MKWKTKDGRELDIKNMETSHIKNCIRMVERNLERAVGQGCSFMSGLQGEMAIDCVEHKISCMESEADEIIGEFKKELTTRGISWKN